MRNTTVDANDVISVIEGQRNQALQALVVSEARVRGLEREVEALQKQVAELQKAAVSEVAPEGE